MLGNIHHANVVHFGKSLPKPPVNSAPPLTSFFVNSTVSVFLFVSVFVCVPALSPSACMSLYPSSSMYHSATSSSSPSQFPSSFLFPLVSSYPTSFRLDCHLLRSLISTKLH